MRRSLVESLELLRKWRGGQPADRAAAKLKLAGMWLGFLDFTRRRFGPPPERIFQLGRK